MVRRRRVRIAGPVLFALAILASPVTARSGSAPATISAMPSIKGLDPAVFRFARGAYESVRSKNHIARRLLTVIDYRKPSTEKRLWVLDMETGAVLFHELVAHGQGSGDNRATRFGNVDSSHRTSLGVFRTAETYRGKHGHSLKLDGHDPGVNDAARSRAIVIHAADYVSERFVRAHGRLGRSHGCPALDPRIARRVIDEVKGGSILVAFGGDDAWVARSPLARP